MKKNNWLKCAVLSSVAAFGFTGNAMAADLEPGTQEFVLDAMVVTASRIPTSIIEAKADISVITRKEIEEQHIDDVEEALRKVPGVQFLNYGTNNMNANLSGIRINGSKDIVILIDGLRITDFQGAGNSGYAYAALMNNMDNIERIEVLRGAAGTVYGSGAKGGVINIITRKATETKSTIDISNGNFSREAYKFNTMGRNKGLSYNAYYNKSLLGDTKDGDGNEWPGSTNSKSAGIKVGYEFNDDHTFTISYDESKSNYNGEDFIYKNHYEGSYDTKNVTLKYDSNIDNHWSNSLIYRKNNAKGKYAQFQAGEEPFYISNDVDYTFISDQITFIDSRNSLIFGIDYSKGYDNIKKSVKENGKRFKANRSMKNYSYYLQNDWKILPTLTLSGGVRYDKPEGDRYAAKFDDNTALSYKLSWDISDKDILYAGRSDFYILPSMTQLYQEKYGNAKLKPAEGRTTSIGYSHKFDDNNIFTLNWFKTESDTLIGYDGDGQSQNYDNGIDRGWNAQFMTQIDDNWSADIGWSHLYHHADGDNFSMGYYPKDMATFAVNYEKEKFAASFSGFYFMRKLNSDFSDVQGWPANNYGVYNLSLNYTPEKNINFYAKVENIFDKLWAEHTNVIHGGDPNSWYAMPGRGIVLGMQLKF